jgi:hypothetical protein
VRKTKKNKIKKQQKLKNQKKRKKEKNKKIYIHSPVEIFEHSSCFICQCFNSTYQGWAQDLLGRDRDQDRDLSNRDRDETFR